MAGGTLRERQRVETRTLILDAALDMFEANGYEQTTVEDIAASAGVSSRTFFRYFDSKTALILDKAGHHSDEESAELMAALVSRPATESVSEALRAVLREHLVTMFDGDGRKLRQLRIVLSEPTLRVLAQDSFHEHRPDLAKAFAARLGTTPDALGPRVLAAAFTEAIWTILEKWSAMGADKTRMPGLIDEAFSAISQGFG